MPKRKQSPKPNRELVWMSVVGRSPFAVLNTIWWALEERKPPPTRFCFLMTDDDPGTLRSYEQIGHWLPILFEGYINTPLDMGDEGRVHRVTIQENDIQGFRELVVQYLDLFSELWGQVAIDMTAGRKFMSGLLMGVGLQRREQVKSLYYNHLLDDQRYYNVPYPLIPKAEQKVVDLLDILEETPNGEDSSNS